MSLRTVFGRGLLMTALIFAYASSPVAEESRRIGGLNPDAEAQQGKVAVYAGDLAGRKTASGVAYDPAKLTAAHANLPFGARLRVTRLDNKLSVVVTVNDRMSSETGRILLLSQAAGAKIKLSRPSVAEVRTELVGMTRVEKPGEKARKKSSAVDVRRKSVGQVSSDLSRIPG